MAEMRERRRLTTSLPWIPFQPALRCANACQITQNSHQTQWYDVTGIGRGGIG